MTGILGFVEVENSELGSFTLPAFESNKRWMELEARAIKPSMSKLNLPLLEDLERRLFKIPEFMEKIEEGGEFNIKYCKNCGTIATRKKCSNCQSEEKGERHVTLDILKDQKDYLEALLIHRGTVDLYTDMRNTKRGDELPSIDVVRCMIFNPFIFKIMDVERKINFVVENDPNLANEKLGVWTDVKYKGDVFAKTNAKESIPASINELLLSQVYPNRQLYSMFVQEKIEDFVKELEKRTDEIVKKNFSWKEHNLNLFCNVIDIEKDVSID